ncbi:MAG: hypothetical protein V1704_02195 [Candidatus Vogelbacteria bacterium]
MANDQTKGGMNWLTGGGMIATALLVDLTTTIITLITFGLGFIINWVPNLFAFMMFSVWLTFKGEANFKRIGILIAPLVAGSAGVPGWTAVIWPLAAKIIAAKTLGDVAPIAGRALNKI